MGQINSATHGRQRQVSSLQRNDTNAIAGGSVNNEAAREVVGGSSAPPIVQTSKQDGLTERRSRRESVRSMRRSMLGMIRSNSSGPTGDMQGGAAKPDDKKRWRVSRRWSKAPAEPHAEPIDSTSKALPTQQDFADDAQEVDEVVHITGKSTQEDILPVPTALDDVNAAGPSSAFTDATSCDDNIGASPLDGGHGGTMTELCSPAGKLVKVDEAIPDTVEVDVRSGMSERQTAPDPPATSVQGTPMAINETTANGPDVNSGGNQAPSSSSAQANSLPGHEERALRPFSPAGTLVVVQGVINTTESPRASLAPAAISAPSDPSRISPALTSTLRPRSQRNSLLSNILHRRNSRSSVRSRGSTVEPGAVDNDIHQTHGANSMGEASNNTISDTSTESTTLDSSGSGTLNSTASGPSALTSDSQELSGRTELSHSVGVLGALLSVATAATAASLLSASPQRQSLLQRAARPQPGSPQVLTPNDQTASPIPALARALATANPVAAAAIAQREREREREETERNRERNFWENMRERVLRGRNRTHVGQEANAPQGRQNGTEPARGPVNSVNPDSLFSTLARAFNLDQTEGETLASTNNSELGQEGTSASGDGERNVDQESAPPGSFERFLIELQMDLRIVLSELESPSSATNSDQNTNSESGNGSIPQGHESTLYNVAPSGNVDNASVAVSRTHESGVESQPEILVSPPGRADLRSPPVGTSVESNNRETLVHDADEDTSTVSTPVVSDELDVPVLNAMPPPTNDAEVTEDTQIPESRSGEQILPPAPPGLRVLQNTGAHTTINSRGVNWRRMYRFPPMRMNPVGQNLPLPTASTSGASSSNNGTGTANEGVSTLASENVPTTGPLDASASPGSLPTSVSDESEGTLSTDGNLVVPVIVVGLQSLNRPSRPTEDSQLLGGPTHSYTEQGDQEAPEQSGSNASAEIDESQRGRNWHSRASRLLNRMGRRNVSGSQEPGNEQETTPSRAFFIYVIGGYYPPDHQIVTGLEYLDSFEALWDLADLLGQVKPPVATEEEIQSSGLEVIKASSLQEFESENKVASNCLDRCLICLDDYEADDDIRLLSCKHAFHKSCVDHWLTKGRNNCPACRGEGVKRNEDQPSQSSRTPV